MAVEKKGINYLLDKQIIMTSELSVMMFKEKDQSKREELRKELEALSKATSSIAAAQKQKILR